MRVLSYNLRNNRAVGELGALVENHDPDVLCVQEAETTTLPATIGSLTLADSTKENRLGLALYYRKNLYELSAVRLVTLKKSLHDMVMKPAHERILGARLRDIDTGKEIVVASFHAAPLTALNSLRRKQIRTALSLLRQLSRGAPVLMVGDYNYPVFKEKLSAQMHSFGYQMALSDSRTYERYRFLRGHYDFVTSWGMHVEAVRTLPQGVSDHLPILITATPGSGA